MFLKNRNISSKNKRSKVTDYAALKKYLQFYEIVNIVNGEETWMHFFEPVRKVGNKIWLTKHGRQLIVAKRAQRSYSMLHSSHVTV